MFNLTTSFEYLDYLIPSYIVTVWYMIVHPHGLAETLLGLQSQYMDHLISTLL